MPTKINHGNFLPDFHSTPLWDFDTNSIWEKEFSRRKDRKIWSS
ncbi:hypothetical protein LEP1GSC016_3286 [Leptospira borgpetersenii serovar Hardjo-bovis str. Sponselee]|uniref:Uncharacterized protein n=1 Tax=Leptospira borgpetersenii serovar Hardjo-bovis str. Sponselee TaxID=1303729 RepID=M6BY04_LEPBO|nr:hypothetical protein LEP1GSC016_3286 [Leptospira borgpetersenii serovar Hardjo-bovis str. Sponselee]